MNWLRPGKPGEMVVVNSTKTCKTRRMSALGHAGARLCCDESVKGALRTY